MEPWRDRLEGQFESPFEQVLEAKPVVLCAGLGGRPLWGELAEMVMGVEVQIEVF